MPPKRSDITIDNGTNAVNEEPKGKHGSPNMTPVSIIATKRDNKRPHSDEEIKWFVQNFTSGLVKDYQMTAWLMAVCLNGMIDRETATLTSAMVNSGRILDWSELDAITVDKHSTGGVGDKISLILAPLVSSFDGIAVPMMAGRGLGHTGGTIDKLETIPGFRTDLGCDKFHDVVSSTGLAIVSPGSDVAVADRKMYALRDVTYTVRSLPLQTSSIMSKKIAENPDSLVLDVKFGRASFNKDTDESIELSKRMIQTGELCGKTTTAFITRMDHPIGNAVGNWLEVLECINVMKSGKGPKDLVNLCLVQAAQMLIQCGAVPSGTLKEGIIMARENLSNGKAYGKFREMVVSQGGDLRCIDKPEDYPRAQFKADVIATSKGFISDINALEIGHIGVMIGAGRNCSEDAIDATAGIWFHRKVGDRVEASDAIATVYTEREETLNSAADSVFQAFSFSEVPVEPEPLITNFVTKDGVSNFSMSIFED
uniref:Thymidine phosphorylase n=1 Tax=Ditylum brightwellii TaxID=49249 RepID=A0A7S4T7X7_9STRA|mmetsp:Transcript_55087/g.81994  ORF Transcript_55087/g.81994 Transcript_55087/m.81994 type:complete len:483 (-) Transcript_55087:63-1511(-)